VDSEAMYIYVPEQKVGFTAQEGDTENQDASELPEAVQMVRKLQNMASLDEATASRSSLRLLGNTKVKLPEGSEGNQNGQRERRPAPFRVTVGGDDDDEGAELDEEADAEDGEEEEPFEDDEDAEAHKRGVLERARRRFVQAPRLEDVVYGTADISHGGSTGSRAPKPAEKATDHKTVPLFDDDEAEDDEADEQRNGNSKSLLASNLLGNMGDLDGLDTARMPTLPGEGGSWDEERREALKAKKFITGGWSSAEEEDDEALAEHQAAEEKQKEAGEGDGEGDGDGDGDGQAEGEAEPKAEKANFDGFEGFSGFPIATFVRVRLEDVPAACVAEITRERPIILGGLLPGESRLGQVQVRTKRHRWHPKLLKSNDALLLSVGWRRFQTVPIFSLEDRGEKRMRYLKYTLEHAHCTMTSYGPMVPPNTGVLAFRSWNKVGHFRVCATGVVLESAPNFEVKKKLKLVGEPYKIFRNTAFIKSMFSSDLEVNKYMHAKIQTVSGIRGEIKKAEGTKGQFRATFEDRILMSDLVVCKCWINVPPKQFYHPVVDVKDWRPARLIGELRAVKGVAVPDNRDSQYGKQHVRPERKFNALKVPKMLQASLPFSAKTKFKGKKKKSDLSKRTAIVSSEKDKAVNSLLNRLYTVRKEKARVKQESNARRKKVKDVMDKFVQDKRDANQLETKKKRYIKEGQTETRKRKAMMMD